MEEIVNKCALCTHYTDENNIPACKVWAYNNAQGIPKELSGCSSFKMREFKIYYLLKISNDPTIYKIKDKTLLEVFMKLKEEEGYSVDDFEIRVISEV